MEYIRLYNSYDIHRLIFIDYMHSLYFICIFIVKIIETNYDKIKFSIYVNINLLSRIILCFILIRKDVVLLLILN